MNNKQKNKMNNIINKVFERVFENTEADVAYFKRDFQCIIIHGELGVNYIGMKESALERKLKVIITRAIEEEESTYDPVVEVKVIYDNVRDKSNQNVSCGISIYYHHTYYSFARITPRIDWKPIVLSEKEVEKLLRKALERMSKELGRNVGEDTWGHDTYCGADGIDTGITIEDETWESDPENPDLEEEKVAEYKAIFEHCMSQCLNIAFPEREWKVEATVIHDNGNEDVFTVYVGIEEVEL